MSIAEIEYNFIVDTTRRIPVFRVCDSSRLEPVRKAG